MRFMEWGGSGRANMSHRKDIIDGKGAESRNYGLVCTRECGWIDLGHASATSARDLYRGVP